MLKVARILPTFIVGLILFVFLTMVGSWTFFLVSVFTIYLFAFWASNGEPMNIVLLFDTKVSKDE